MSTDMPPVYIDFLNRFDVEALHLTDAEIIAAIEGALRLQGQGSTVSSPASSSSPASPAATSTSSAAPFWTRRATAP